MNIYFFKLYRWIFCRPFFYGFNKHLFKLSLRGLGVLNSEVSSATGEDFLLKNLSKVWSPKVIIDVGSNTDAYGSSFFPKANIFAIEPHPETFKKLQKIFKGKSRVKKYNLAMSSKNGQAKLWDFAKDAELKSTQPTSQLSSLNKDVIENLHGQKAQSFVVQKMTLDSFASKHSLTKIDFLKIDTEGHELEVLKGAKNLLKNKKIDLIQFEFNEMNVLSGSFLRNFIELLPSYHFFRLMPRGLYPLDNYSPLTHELFGFQNILAVPVDKLDLIETFAK